MSKKYDRIPKSGAFSCPEYDIISGKKINPHNTKLFVDENGVGRCVPQSFRSRGYAAADHGQRNNITDLVAPYSVNIAQRQQLAYLLGKNQVSNMEVLNALSYAGFINSSCPPVGAPNDTEEYINLITGKRQCRKPMKNRKQFYGIPPNGCPVKYGDPKAIEHYVDKWHRGQCRRPVLSGKFECDLNQKLVVLENGQGICVKDPYFSPDPFVFPRQLVYPAAENKKIMEYLTLYNRYNLDLESILRLNNIFVGSEPKKLTDVRVLLSNDPHNAIFSLVAGKLKKMTDVKSANNALLHYFRLKHGQDYRSIISNPMKYLKFLGFSPKLQDAMLGGCLKCKN